MNCIIIALGDLYAFSFAKNLLNKKCAQIFMTYSLFNLFINDCFCKTLTNGPEAVFCIMALYYYTNL